MSINSEITISSDNSIAISSSSTGAYSEIVMSLESEHEGLSQVDLILDEVGYGLVLYFEPMEWDELDNETRVEIAKSALEYAYAVTKEYTNEIVTYAGYINEDKLIVFNSASGFIVVTDTNGSNAYGTDIWP